MFWKCSDLVMSCSASHRAADTLPKQTEFFLTLFALQVDFHFQKGSTHLPLLKDQSGPSTPQHMSDFWGFFILMGIGITRNWDTCFSRLEKWEDSD